MSRQTASRTSRATVSRQRRRGHHVQDEGQALAAAAGSRRRGPGPAQGSREESGSDSKASSEEWKRMWEWPEPVCAVVDPPDAEPLHCFLGLSAASAAAAAEGGGSVSTGDPGGSGVAAWWWLECRGLCIRDSAKRRHQRHLLADLQGSFRESLVYLKQLLAETHVALHRRDYGVRLGAALRAQRRSAREVSRLASTARDLSHCAAPDDESDEATLSDAFAATTTAVAAASSAVFAGVSAASAESAASAAPSPRTPTPYSPAGTPGSPMWLVTDLLRRRRAVSFKDSCNEEEEERKAAMGRVRGLAECVDAAETGCEEVYRALVNSFRTQRRMLLDTGGYSRIDSVMAAWR